MSTPTPPSARSRWVHLAWIVPAALLLVAIVVFAARGIRELPAFQDFLVQYPGTSELPDGTPVGISVWQGWQHFLNSFFLVFIVRSGWELRKKQRPAAFWTRRNDRLIRTKGAPVRIGVPLWFHLVVDVFWVANGVVFIVLLFVTGQWARLVPTSWDVFPNAISAGVQYASLDWPVENGWINYNALQLLTYFITVFIASPLALATGIRLAPGFAARLRPLDKIVPLKLTKQVHFAVMIWFVGFTITHVTLVLATGALRNLNHMYAARDEVSWVGAAIFAASLVLMVVAWFVATPKRQADLAELTGTVRR